MMPLAPGWLASAKPPSRSQIGTECGSVLFFFFFFVTPLGLWDLSLLSKD